MKKGFTLIEMLIVVVIVGILASALIPRLTSAKDKTENTGAIKDLSDIVTALEIYQIDNGTYPVSPTCDGTVKTDCTLSGVMPQLKNYLKSMPQGNTKLGQWTIGNGYIVSTGSAYGYVGMGKRYILSYQFVDTRDGQRYKAVRMPDEKWWMAESLNFKTATSFCYDDIEANCGSGYGRLYIWDEGQTTCPPGWRLPTDDEWTVMLNKVESLYGGVQDHGTMYNWYGSSADIQLRKDGTDVFGLSILGGGARESGGLYSRRPRRGIYMSSTDWRFRLFDGWGKVFHHDYNWGTKTMKYSVRCVRN